MEYLFSGQLDNTVHDISSEHIEMMFLDNEKEERKSRKMTESSYRGENFYQKYGDNYFAFMKEYLERDPRTSGMRLYYPHGVVVEQAHRGNYYRGENQIYPESLPTLQRSLKRFSSIKEKELYRLVADMRIAEFKFFLEKFQHVREWKISDVLYDAIAQHYGLETSWLDITSDFKVAMFFATCYWDNGKWKPLTKEQTEVDEAHRYGMIFHMPSNRMSMRCHMQNGYGIYMRTPHPLQKDSGFEKLRFRHSEALSQRVFDLMKGGELIYPHEGLGKADFIIDQIRNACVFSREAFQYALYKNHYYKISDESVVQEELHHFYIGGKRNEISDNHPWRISSGRRKKIDEIYKDFSVESWYGIRVLDRQKIPEPSAMFEPWMIPEENDGAGVTDFRVREKVNCGHSIIERDYFNLLSTMITQSVPDF